jgi:hypothetical protein
MYHPMQNQWRQIQSWQSSAQFAQPKASVTNNNPQNCNRTDQIIRAQVQKQAPKRSNFRT